MLTRRRALAQARHDQEQQQDQAPAQVSQGSSKEGGKANRARSTAKRHRSPEQGEEEQATTTVTETEEDTSEEGSKAKRARSTARSATARAPSPKAPLDEAVAGLVEVLGVPALQQRLERPHRAAALAARDLASLGEAIGFPLHPAVNQAMLAQWERLQAPASSWMADLPHTLKGFDPETSKLPALKALCRACSLPVTGTKPELQSRLKKVLPLLPQHIPLALALALKPQLATTARARDALAALAAEEGAGDERITASRAKGEWCLNDGDLAVS